MKTIDTLLFPWEERALKKGRREGRELGRQQGRQEGRQEGREAGLIEGLRAAVLEILEFRFGSVPGAVRERLAANTEARTLREAQRLALSVPSLVEFSKNLD